MMKGYFLFPPKTLFGKPIPKIKIYQFSDLNSATKEKFVSEVDKIIWQHKLSKETTNLAGTKEVPEIQIFNIYAKEKEVSEIVLKTIDRAIPFPIIFQIFSDDKIKIKAAYKRPSDSDKAKWVIDKYLETEWFDKNEEQKPLPLGLDLSKVYEQILHDLIPIEINHKEDSSIEDKISTLQKIQQLEKKYAQLKSKRDKEKQFNKRVELNDEIRILMNELNILKGEK